MPDKPDLCDEGERHDANIVTQFELNQAFIDEVGVEKAEQLRSVLAELTAAGFTCTDAAEKELRSRLSVLGIEVSDPEVTAFADQIVRSVGPVSVFDDGSTPPHQ
ncbi:Uncharacterised protein [Dermatophilus congolensis]|uniref:Uncharacterized protein n=1 Tax=Dermatophilus congolensis TaxID=1863 RepID=A0A239V8X8_9MICO|nr:hypothetical protein [Dermatophilus congolensis]SNV18516.1 Uncharacterised protein [Dermatophilus congolensis]